MKIFIHQGNVIDSIKQYRSNRIETITIAQTKTLEDRFKLATRLAHNTLGKEKSKYCWQYFTVSILLVVKSFMKNLLMTESRDRKSDLVTYIIVIIIIIIIIIIIYMYLIRKTICNTLELAVLETASRPTLFYSYGNHALTTIYWNFCLWQVQCARKKRPKYFVIISPTKL